MIKPHWSSSLRFRLVAGLAVIQFAFLAVELVGLTRYVGDVLNRTAESEAAQLGQVIRQTVRQQMLRGAGGTLQATMADLRGVKALDRLSIIDNAGKVAHSTDEQLIGRVLDRQRDPVCLSCHTGKGTRTARTALAVDEHARPFVRHVEVIANEPACASCHDAKSRVNGIILVEESTLAFQDALAAITRRVTLTGAATLAGLLGVTLFISTIMVVRPVGRLFTAVGRIGAGDLQTRVSVEGRGELSQLSVAVNGMAEDLGRSIDEIRNKTAELSVVYSILGRVTKSINLSELKDVVLETFNEVLHAERTLLLSRTARGLPVEVLSKAAGGNRIDRTVDEDSVGMAVREGFPADVLYPWLMGRRFDPFVTPDRRVAAIPVETVAGASYLLAVRRSQPFSEGEANTRLLALIASHVAGAFENSRLYTLAITDELTQLFAARHLYAQAESLVSKCRSDGSSCALLMLDLDFFKLINDKWGHPAGDAVLKNVAGQIARLIRFGDSAYRYGGEEFVVLLPGTDLAAAEQIAERIRAGIENTSTTAGTADGIRVTASIGVACCPQDATSGHDLIRMADQALYAAKRAGRNRVERVPSLAS